jgi:DNA adenine methylase
VREARFNPWRQRLFATPDGDTDAAPLPTYPAELAAMLIYLNRTGYNGLFRLNRRGAFNVPAGRYTNPRICDAETLRAVAAALRRPGVSVRQASFDRAAVAAQPEDFLYFDPPYAPLSATARFTAYTADGFDEAAQVRLHQVMLDLARRGCRVLLSNSTAPVIHALYGRGNADARAAGLRTVKVPARRAINSRATHRGQVEEYLITNLPSRSRSV